MISIVQYLSEESDEFKRHIDAAADHYARNFPHVEGVGISERARQHASKEELEKSFNRLRSGLKKDLKNQLKSPEWREKYSKPFDKKEYEDKGFNSEQIQNLRILHNHMNNAIKTKITR